MGISKDNLNLVLGLKVGWLRQQRQLSLKELSEKCGLSISYLNEIEKGKKYPKADKIMALSEALDIPYNDLVSLQLNQRLAPLSDLLSTSIMQEIPFHVFGLNKSHVMELMTNDPARFAALVDTLNKMARGYDIGVEDILFGTLRSYLEMNANYFPEIEVKAEAIRKKYGWDYGVSTNEVRKVLEEQFNYQTDFASLAEIKQLKHIRSVFLPKRPPVFYLNPNLLASQKTFALLRELGYEEMGIQERVSGSSILFDATFDQMLNSAKVSYFAGAIMLPAQEFSSKINKLLSQKRWDNNAFESLIHQSGSTPEMFFFRMTQVLSHYSDLGRFFFMRFKMNTRTGAMFMEKELHFSGLHQTHGIGSQEHYCRRWLTSALLKEVSDTEEIGTIKTGIQRSDFYQTGQEYISLSAARPLVLSEDLVSCVTIGFPLNDDAKQRIHFWDDEAIPRQIVNRTCERCPISDCQVRAAEPVKYLEMVRKADIRTALDALYASGISNKS